MTLEAARKYIHGKLYSEESEPAGPSVDIPAVDVPLPDLDEERE